MITWNTYESLSNLISDLRLAFDMVEDLFSTLRVHDEKDRDIFDKIALLHQICRQRIEEITKVIEEEEITKTQ